MDIFLPEVCSFFIEESLDAFVCAIADIEHASTSMSIKFIFCSCFLLMNFQFNRYKATF